jgi:hypothetical protein
MNRHAVWAIYAFEMARWRRTVMQSIISPVLSTTLYFVVFGAAIGSHIPQVDGVSYGAFIVPGLIMLSVLTQSVSNASFGIYFPRFTGSIYELLSAPVSYVEVLLSYVGAAATKSIILGLIILATATLFVPLRIDHPSGWLVFLVLTACTFSLLGFIIGIWARRLRETAGGAAADHHAARLPRRQLLLDQHAAAAWQHDLAVQSRGLSHQRRFRWSFYGVAWVAPQALPAGAGGGLSPRSPPAAVNAGYES